MRSLVSPTSEECEPRTLGRSQNLLSWAGSARKRPCTQGSQAQTWQKTTQRDNVCQVGDRQAAHHDAPGDARCFFLLVGYFVVVDKFDGLDSNFFLSVFRLGCIFDWADNYDAQATTDDGSCDRLGCMSDWADNDDELATTDDESCDRLGCMSCILYTYQSPPD